MKVYISGFAICFTILLYQFFKMTPLVCDQFEELLPEVCSLLLAHFQRKCPNLLREIIAAPSTFIGSSGIYESK